MSLERSIKSCPEQRINDEIRFPENLPRELRSDHPGLQLHFPKGEQGVPLKAVCWLQQKNVYGITALRQNPSGNKAISAIVPRPAEDSNARARSAHLRGTIGHQLSGPTHQFDTGHPGIDRRAIRAPHFLRRQYGKIQTSRHP